MSMTVAEVEAATGVSADAIRWYVRKGILKPRRNSRNRYCEFGAVDLLELRFIGRAKSLGFTLAEVRDVLAMSRRHESPCPTVREIVKRRVIEVAARLEALQAMDRHMAPRPAHLEAHARRRASRRRSLPLGRGAHRRI